MVLKNRIIMAPMTTRLATDEGFVTDASVAYFSTRAAGGVGLVTVEMASPERAGRHRANELGIYDDRFLPGLRRLVDTLHQCGSKVSIQLGHAGGHTREDICGETPIAPSRVPHDVYEVTAETIIPLEMSLSRISQTVQAFVDAAHRARAAGFDCIEIHGAHGYLLSQFLCPKENNRNDEYGGELENRSRFSLEILSRIKSELPDFAVIYRLSADDFFPEGLTFTEAIQVAKWAAQAGADAIHVSAAHYRSLPSAEVMIPPMAYPEATFLHYAARIKREVNVPVIAVGRLGTPKLAVEAIESGSADFIALGRSLLADPDWVNNVQNGTPIRRCLSCNTCVNDMRSGRQLECLVNPAAAHELQFPMHDIAVRNERICVLGAGPAGLSYASLVAKFNHVTVIERTKSPGGAFCLAGKAPKFQEVVANQDSLNQYIQELERLCRHRNVTFLYDVDIERRPEILRDFDRVVIATGARYRLGMNGIITFILNRNWGKSWVARKLFAYRSLRNWFYYKARKPTGQKYRQWVGAGQTVTVIGDALRAGKSKEAIDSAYVAAFGRSK